MVASRVKLENFSNRFNFTATVQGGETVEKPSAVSVGGV